MRKGSKPTAYPGVSRIREGRYRVRAKVTDPRTGRMREIDREVEARSPLEASAVRDRLRTEARAPAELTERPRLGDFAASWLTSRAAELKRSTSERYGDALELHIAPVFGDWYLDAITEADVARWRDAMPGAPASRNGRLRVLRTLLEAAVPQYLARNPASRIGAVREKRRENDPNRLTADELRAVLGELATAHARSVAAIEKAMRTRPGVRARVPMAYPITFALITTGGRWGEVSALRWSEVDVVAGVIRIERAHYRGTIDSTKTGTVRTVPLTPELGHVLEAHRRLLVQAQHPGLAAGWVFPSVRGGLRTSSSIVKPLVAALKKAGVRRRQTVHGLRRTLNDLLRQVTTGEVVRAVTGHVTERMTEHYSHVAAAEKSAAVSRALRLVVGGAGGDVGGDRAPGAVDPKRGRP